jgi:hypothetical protein
MPPHEAMQSLPRTTAPFPVALETPHQGRFWDEAVRLPAMFEWFRSNGDHPNAVACFDRLAQLRFPEIAGRPGYDSSKKSIVAVFQAKSGGTYLHNRLLQLGYQDFSWMFPHRNCHSYCYASDAALDLYLTGGCACQTHARPDPNILSAWDRAGVQRIWLHLRNPAETCVSSYQHFIGDLGLEGPIAEHCKQAAAAEADRLGIDVAKSKSDFAMEQIDWHVQWVAEWLQFAEEHPQLVVCSYYDELADPYALLSRVFRELGAVLPTAELAEAGPQDRYRKKASKNWRDGLTPEAQRHIGERVQVGLLEFDAFERLWS